LITYANFKQARVGILSNFLRLAYEVPTSRWQGVDVSSKSEMRMHEMLFTSYQVFLNGEEDPEHWEHDTKCNMPFARVHFLERVGREPTNPGEAWKIWPWGHNAAKFLEADGGKFSHTYQERFWPKFAKPGGMSGSDTYKSSRENDFPRHGIRYEYGDLDDLVAHLRNDPLSRQAYLPIWFPEDGTCPGRKPCTLGYHFINRGGRLHVTYYIRSCDFVRHWADDCYLTVRLLTWVLDELRKRDDYWLDITPGLFVMHIGSLHCFANDLPGLRKEDGKGERE
jgi:hypothetical protein